jgi:hypothetical protein
MRNNIIISVVVIAAAIAGLLMFRAYHSSKPLNEARQCELSGDLQQALSQYAGIVFNRIPTLKIPDINESKYLAPDLLKKDVASYFAWLSIPAARTDNEVSAALGGIGRLESRCRGDNGIFNTKIQPLTSEKYREEWNRTFFAPNVKIDQSHAALAEGNYIRKFSLLVIKSGQSYTYEINCINPATMRGIKATLLPENSVRLYAVPGEHLLLCRSSVTFESGEIWYSQYTPIRLTIPTEPSLVSVDLRTTPPLRMK